MITGVDFTTVPANDLEASMRFYGDVLGLPFVKRWGSGVCHQALFRDPAGNTLDIHHRYAD